MPTFKDFVNWLDRDKEKEGFQLRKSNKMLSPVPMGGINTYGKPLVMSQPKPQGIKRFNPLHQLNAITPGGLKAGWERVKSAPKGTYNVLSPLNLRRGQGIANMFAKRTKSFVPKTALYGAGELLGSQAKGFETTQKGIKEKNIGKTVSGLWQSVKTPVALQGGVPAALIATGLGGGLSGAVSTLQGGDKDQIAKNIGQGGIKGLQTRAVTRFTDPAIGKLLAGLPKMPFAKKQAITRLIGGVTNVGEDILIDTLDEVPRNAMDELVSFLMGAAGAGNVELLGRIGKLMDQKKIDASPETKAKVRRWNRDWNTGRFAKETKDKVVKFIGDTLPEQARRTYGNVTHKLGIPTGKAGQKGAVDLSIFQGKKNFEGEVKYLQDKYPIGEVQLKMVKGSLEKGSSVKDIETFLDRVYKRTPEVKAEAKAFFKGEPYKPETVKLTEEKPVKIKTQGDIKVDSIVKAKSQQVVDDFLPIIKGVDDSIKSKGLTFADLVDDIEGGKVRPELKAEVDEVKNFFDTFKKVREQKFGDKIGTLEDYWHRISEGNLENIQARSFGETVIKAGFAEKRKGTLSDYVKDYRVLETYMKQALGGDMPETEINKVRLANEVKKEVESTKDVLDIVAKVNKANIGEGEGIAYKDTGKIPPKIYTSTATRSDRAGKQFYDAFFKPFRDVDVETGKYKQSIKQMSDEELRSQIRWRNAPEQYSRTELIEMLTRTKRKELSSDAANTFLENVNNAEFGSFKQKELVNDIFDEYIASQVRERTAVDKISNIITGWTGRGAMWLNVSSAINNLFETKRIVSLVSTKNFAKASKRLLSGENVTQKWGVDLESSNFIERNNAKKLLATTDKVGFAMFDATEKLKDNYMLLALEEQGKSKGLTGEALKDFVVKKFDYYAIKYGKGQNIGLYKNPIAQALLQFGQYKIKDLEIALNKSAGALKGDWGDIKYLTKYAALSVAQIALMKKLIGTIGFGGQTGTPLDFIQEIYQTFDNDPDSRGLGVSPIANFVGGLLSYAIQSPNLDEYEKSQKIRGLKRSAATVAIPGSNQLIFKTGDYLKNRLEGNYKTYSGNVAGPVGTSPADTAKGILFGKSYDSKRQQYIKDIKGGYSPSLSVKQSKIYKDLPDNKKEKYYEDAVAYDKITKDVTAQLSESDKKIWETYKYSKDGVLNSQQKAQLLLNNQNIQAVEMAIAKASGNPYNPMWDLSWEQRNQVLASKTNMPGDKTYEDKYLWDQEWFLDFKAKESEYFKYLETLPGYEKKKANRPLPSKEVQEAMDRKEWSAPGVKEYLMAKDQWENEQREKLGLVPMSGYGSFYGNYEPKVKAKKVTITKPKTIKLSKGSSKAGKIKLKKIKASKRKKKNYTLKVK